MRPPAKPERLSPRLRWALAAALLLGAAAPAMGGARLAATGSVEVAFSPEDDPEAVLLDIIGSARRSLRVQAYLFTSRRLADALIDALRRGVDVAVLADAAQNARGGGQALPRLLAAGVPVAFETRYAAAHNKVIIADGEGPACVVATGSYNYTWSARHRNAENLLVLRDNCALAATYLENWRRHRAEATPIDHLPWRPEDGRK